MKIVTVAEMIAAEKAANDAGISYAQMMETAGKAVADAILARHPVTGQRVHVLVGTGNNGGDGLVAARHLAAAGAIVTVYLHRPRVAETDVNYAKLLAMGVEMSGETAVSHQNTIAADILIDALLGTGVTRPIAGRMAELLRAIQKSGFLQKPDFLGSPTIVAVDCPSGLNCDTGALDPLAMTADLTVTFGAAKRGHFRFPGAAACGQLRIADIGIPPTLPAIADVPLTLADGAMGRGLLPPRPQFGHKGTFGTALIAAGSNRYWGAPLLAGRAAYRVGVGIVALAVPAAIRAAMATGLPEATYPLVQDEAVFSPATVDLLLNGRRADALLVGPGISEEAGAFMDALLAHADALPPLVVDADGLNLLATLPNWAQKLPPNSILTPHPGEMARLMGVPLADLLTQDRVMVAQAMAQKWGHTVLLKGAYTVIAAADGRVTLLPFANPLLGVAGSGDVLAGAIVGLLAGQGRGGAGERGSGGWDVAVLAAYLHGLAGDSMAEQLGDAGLLASELADALPLARKQLTFNK